MSQPTHSYTARFRGLVDLVQHEGRPAFLIKEADTLTIASEVVLSDRTYLPPPKSQIPWLLPRGAEVIRHYTEDTDQALFDDLVAYHKSIAELPGEAYYDLIAAWDLHTYILEAVQYSPIICFFAIAERGKSRTGKGMIHVAYRGLHVVSLRDAYLVRVAENFQSSLFFDTMDIWEEATKEGSADILLGRFEKGAVVPRVNNPDLGAFRDTIYYHVFGPTVIATNEAVHRILDTRAIQIKMPETGKRFENDVRPELALSLKERLVAFRARHLGEPLSDISKPSAGRLGDILKPLLQIIQLVRPERTAAFLGLVKQLAQDRLKEKADTPEAQLLHAVLEIKADVKRGLLPNKLITEAFNKNKLEREKRTYTWTGKRLDAMGFDKSCLENGASAIVWDEAKIGLLCEKYGVPNPSAASGAPSDSSPKPWDGQIIEPPDAAESALKDLQISDEEIIRRRAAEEQQQNAQA